MRILHIISRMDPAGGGPQEVVRLLLRYAPAGYAQEVVTLDDPAAAFLQNETAPVHALGRSGTRFAAPQLTRWLIANRDRFDGIILHGLWEYASFAVLRTIAGHRPYVVFPHGMLDPYFKRASPLKHLKKWLYWLPVQYWTLRRAQRVLFTTAAERDLATQSFWLHRWNPIVVALGAETPPTDLYPGTEEPPVESNSSGADIGRPETSAPGTSGSRASAPHTLGPEARSIPAWGEAPRTMHTGETGGPEARSINSLGFLESFYDRSPAVRGKRFLLFLGRIDPKKGCDLLVDAFAALQQTASSSPIKFSSRPERSGVERPAFLSTPMLNPDLHLVLAGPDPDNWGEHLRKTLQAAGIADHIHFPGMLTGNAKWGAFTASEAFILPSHQENFGIAVVEALACGRPVLITHAVNIAADLAADGCALVEDDTLQGTANLLTRWLQLPPEERANMGQRARNAFATRYDMRMNAHAILRCFEGQTGHEVDPA
jgi:glycosyltransferase involved in cell wall biosynthesis